MKKFILVSFSAFVVVLIAVLLILDFVVYPKIVKEVQHRVERSLDRIARRTGRATKAKEITVSNGDLIIRDFRLMDKEGKYPVVSIKKISLHITPFQLLRGDPVGPLLVEDMAVKIRIDHYQPLDLIDLFAHLKSKIPGSKAGKAGKHEKKMIKKFRLSGFKLKNLAIEIKDNNVEGRIITLDHVNGDIQRGIQGMKGTIEGYLWISKTGMTRMTGTYDNGKLKVSLSSGITLPSWLFRHADTLSFKGISAVIGKTLSISLDQPIIKYRGRKNYWKVAVERVDLSADKFTLKTRILPLYPFKILAQNMSIKALSVIRHKDRKIYINKGKASISVADMKKKFKLKFEGQISIQEQGQTNKIEIDVTGDKTSRFRQVEMNLSGPILNKLIALFDPHMIVLPESSGSVHFELADTLDNAWSFSGHAALDRFGYFSTRLCLSPVFGLSIKTDFDGSVTADKHHLMLNFEPMFINDIKMNMSFTYDKNGKRPAKMQFSFHLPRQPCENVLAAIPLVMRPRLTDMKVKGFMSVAISISTDLKDIFARTKFNANVDLKDCKVLTLGSTVNLDWLNTKFVLKRPDPQNKGKFILIGPGTDNYVPIKKIPVWVQQAALATEDMAFFVHKGFKPGLIRRAIALDLDHGWYVYGGSTITQQLVKNLFLSTEKSLSRKLEEAIITWQMEQKFEKDKILELYLNCIEYGKGVYGIKQAAKVYFNKTPSRLTPLEAAWIMATKPSPKYAYRVYKRRTFNKWWVDRMRSIMLRLWKEMHVIDEHAFLNAAPYLPAFYYADKGVYLHPKVRGNFEIPKGIPKELPDKDIEKVLPNDIRRAAPPIIDIRRIESWW